MIYVVGDSFSFGYNFWQQGLARDQLVYAHHLGKHFGHTVQNLSIPAGSNWRCARLLNTAAITKQDIVVVAWTAVDRYEVATQREDLSPLDRIFDTTDKDIRQREDVKFMLSQNQARGADILQYVERTGSLLTRRLTGNLFDSGAKVRNQKLRNLQELLYNNFYSDQWSEEMFVIMCQSAIYRLQKIGCRFVMFNAWRAAVSQPNPVLEIPQYLFGADSHMTEIIRNNNQFTDSNTIYWSPEEHQQVAEIIIDHLEKQ